MRAGDAPHAVDAAEQRAVEVEAEVLKAVASEAAVCEALGAARGITPNRVRLRLKEEAEGLRELLASVYGDGEPLDEADVREALAPFVGHTSTPPDGGWSELHGLDPRPGEPRVLVDAEEWPETGEEG